MRLTNFLDELRADHPWIDAFGISGFDGSTPIKGDGWKNWGTQYAGSGPLGVTVHHTGASIPWNSILRFEWFKYENVKATNCNISPWGAVAVMSAGGAATNGTVTKRAFSRGMGGGNGDQWTIEAHNPGDGSQPYSEAQMRSILAVCYTVNRLSRNQLTDVCTHREVASPFGRKSDPAMARNVEGPYAGRIRPTGPGQTWNPDDLRTVAAEFGAAPPPPPPPDDLEDQVLASCSWGRERLDLFSVGAAGNLVHKWLDKAEWLPEHLRGVWSEWENLGGIIRYGPAACAQYDGRIDVFAIGVDGSLWQIAWDGVQGGWTGWFPHGGQFTGAPTVSSWAPGHLSVMGPGLDQRVYEKEWKDGAWSDFVARGPARP